jgi:hypothetical protein
VIGGPVWCARRWDGTGDALNATSSDDLACQIEQEEGPR